MADVKMRITATDAASPTIQKVKGELAGLDRQAGTAAGGLSSLAKVAGAAGLAAFAVSAGKAAIELAELGSATRSMKAAFEGVAGSAENATAIIEALQQASRGTISEFELMQAASKGVLLGVADTAEEFSALMEIAIVRGKALGLTAQQAFSDLVTGLGRESALILDNLGIVVDVEGATKDYAATLGKTADQLSATERKQALVNQVLANSATLLDDANQSADALAGEGMAALSAGWDDFRRTIGVSISEILDARYRELADFLSAGVDEINRQRAAVGLTEGTNASGLTDSGDISAVLTVDLERARADLAALQDELISTAQNAEAKIRQIYSSTPNLSLAEAGAIYQSVIDGLIANIAETEAKIADLEAKIGDLVSTAPAFQVFIPAFGNMAAAADGATQSVLALGETIRAVQRQASAADRVFGGRGIRTGAGDIGLNRNPNILTAGRSAALGRPGPVVGDITPILSGTGGGGGGGFSAIDNELNRITSKVQSVLQGALKSGIDLDEILGRQDAIEEPARRLADVAVKGFDSPWAAYIKDTFPALWAEITSSGDIKTSAAQVLKDFEDGLRPELLDKERAKDLVRRALLGEQNTAALAAEIAGELSSELGISLAQAQQAASGVLGTGSTPDESGMSGAVVAAAFVDDFGATISGMLTRFESNGASSGAAFQVGFLGVVQQGLPSGILAALAAQLLPMLAAGFAAQGSRTGAQ